MRSLARHSLIANYLIRFVMRLFNPFPLISVALSLILLCTTGCSNPLGKSVKEPFTGSKYESNNRYYRGTGNGSSQMDNVAQSQAELRARQQLAQQVQTNFEVVTDDYQRSTSGEHVDEAMNRFETLAREITSSNLVDIRIIGSEKYLADDGSYTCYVAMEIKKNAMYRYLKKQAKLNKNVTESELIEIENLLNQLIEEVESD
ncbi:MAG: hypothetical protein CL845_06435 [Crocinitomicaceae bacterium]|nr:hypothetical protein [Crocinitomicaceae bacterium]